jgi:hypothetical protein
MKHAAFSTAIAFALSIVCAPVAYAQHSLRVDEGSPCMTTWTQVLPAPALASDFNPAGVGGDTVAACIPQTAGDLFYTGAGPNTAFNDAATVDSSYTATAGQMFQFYSAGNLASQAVIFTLGTKDETEIELNGWCSGTTGGSFTWGNTTYTGGCGSTTDFLFDSSNNLAGYVTDSTGGPSTIYLATSLPTNIGWTESGGGSTVMAPEIDPQSSIAAITLLAGCLVVLQGNRRRLRRAAIPV